ncbi:hypothetical protein L873DRAFT_1840978 [Choiromyces venosus 120613-1]|uniref:Tc1-like transposase DDE domain-containing protein n=1 Tax=Choiromyces venosus 120613-1 TaxID=1336337 RepID=A0A3N4K5Q3_9PEZI|nr:hypothetical protein L873DRAFT_1840978 [Choiromyces venosus 120613-1]
MAPILCSYVHKPIPLVAGYQEGKEKKGRGRYLKTFKVQNEAMVKEGLKNHNTIYKDIVKKIALEVPEKTIKCRLAEKDLEIYPKKKWNKDCVEPSTRVGERKLSQIMTGFFYGQRHSLFLPVFPDPSSAGSTVTGMFIIDVYDHYDFVKIWEDIKRELEEEEVFLIIDNAKTYLPFMR